MSNLNKAFLDYYQKHDISPVAQDVSDLQKHFSRRQALYQYCGIPLSFIQDKTVLEIGPGTGHNAIVTNAMSPKQYTLLDGNPKSCQETENTLKKYFSTIDNCEIVYCDFNDYAQTKKYDLVLCEGTIPWQKSPVKFLKKVASHVKPGGVLLITCSDPVSYLSEVLRRLAARLILNGDIANTETALKKLNPFFSDQLSHLQGMSRSVDDWVHDNILQPLIGEPLSLEDATCALADHFAVYGSSPKFLTDWRWYKDIHGKNTHINTIAQSQFRTNVHNQLDYRQTYAPIPECEGIALNLLCEKIMHQIFCIDSAECLKTETAKIVNLLLELKQLIEEFASETSQSLNEFILATKTWVSTGRFSENLPLFSPWFGRGQQYLSFVKEQVTLENIIRNPC